MASTPEKTREKSAQKQARLMTCTPGGACVAHRISYATLATTTNVYKLCVCVRVCRGVLCVKAPHT